MSLSPGVTGGWEEGKEAKVAVFWGVKNPFLQLLARPFTSTVAVWAQAEVTVLIFSPWLGRGKIEFVDYPTRQCCFTRAVFLVGPGYCAPSVDSQVGETKHSIRVNGIVDGNYFFQCDLKLTHLCMRGYWGQIGLPKSWQLNRCVKVWNCICRLLQSILL